MGPIPDLLSYFNPSNSEINPICHLLTLLGAHTILHISRIRDYVFNIRHPKMSNMDSVIPCRQIECLKIGNPASFPVFPVHITSKRRPYLRNFKLRYIPKNINDDIKSQIFQTRANVFLLNNKV